MFLSVSAKYIGQELLNPVAVVQVRPGQDLLKLTPVKPEAVIARAFVDHQKGIGPPNSDFCHFLVADGTPARQLGRRATLLEGTKEVFGLCRIAQQYLELTGVKPDTPATRAVVDLHVGQFQRNHGIVARWAIHVCLLMPAHVSGPAIQQIRDGAYGMPLGQWASLILFHHTDACSHGIFNSISQACRKQEEWTLAVVISPGHAIPPASVIVPAGGAGVKRSIVQDSARRIFALDVLLHGT